jgi:hypothetical protein
MLALPARRQVYGQHGALILHAFLVNGFIAQHPAFGDMAF